MRGEKRGQALGASNLNAAAQACMCTEWAVAYHQQAHLHVSLLSAVQSSSSFFTRCSWWQILPPSSTVKLVAKKGEDPTGFRQIHAPHLVFRDIHALRRS